MGSLKYEIRVHGGWVHETYDFASARQYYTELCRKHPKASIELVKVSEQTVLAQEAE